MRPDRKKRPPHYNRGNIMKAKGNIAEVTITQSLHYIAEYNGFTGIGETREEAETALDWACRKLPLNGQRITTVTFDEMTRNGWN